MGEAVVLCYPGGGAGREWLAMEETRERRIPCGNRMER